MCIKKKLRKYLNPRNYNCKKIEQLSYTFPSPKPKITNWFSGGHIRHVTAL